MRLLIVSAPVVDAQAGFREDVLKMGYEHTSDLFDALQPGCDDFAIPFLEGLVGAISVGGLTEVAPQLLDHSGLGGLELRLSFRVSSFRYCRAACSVRRTSSIALFMNVAKCHASCTILSPGPARASPSSSRTPGTYPSRWLPRHCQAPRSSQTRLPPSSNPCARRPCTERLRSQRQANSQPLRTSALGRPFSRPRHAPHRLILAAR